MKWFFGLIGLYAMIGLAIGHAQAPQGMTPSQVAVAINTAVGQLAQQAEAWQRQVGELQVQVKNLTDQLDAERKKHTQPPPAPPAK